MEAPQDDTNSLRHDDGIDAKGPDSATSQIPNPQQSDGNTTLSDELRQIQKRLVEIDQQTQKNPEGLLRANLIDSIINGRDIPNSNSHPAIGPPHSYFSPSANWELSQLDGARKRLSELVLAPSDASDPIQRYLQFERSRLEVKHRQEKLVLLLTESHIVPQRAPITVYDVPPGHIPTGNIENGNAQPSMEDLDGDSIIRYLSWEEFRHNALVRGATSYAIEVLDGEPILSGASYFGASYIPEKSTILQYDKSESASRDPTVIGQIPLPERIRIRSRALHGIVNFVVGTNRAVPTTRRTFVMVRPFKFFSFHRDRLQELYNKLDAKFSPSTNIEENMLSDTSRDGASEIGASRGTMATTRYFQTSTPKPSPDPGGVAGWIPGKGPPGKVKAVGQVEEEDIMSLPSFLHLRCLLKFIDTTIVEKEKNLKEHCKKVSFVDLWHLFKPGVEVVELGDRYMQCYKVVNVTSPMHKATPSYFYPYFGKKGKTESTVSIYCVYVDFDGSVLGPVSKRFDIGKYNGLKEITSLPVYPLNHVKNSTSVRRTLIDRGTKFLKALQVGHMHYNGLTLESRDEVDSQVVVDFTEALAHREDGKNTNWKPKVQLGSDFMADNDDASDNASNTEASSVDEDEIPCTAECCEYDYVYNDNWVDEKQNEQFLSNLLADTDEEENPASLAVVARALRRDQMASVTDDDKVIMTYRVFGFVLRSRSWAKLNISDLMDLEEYRKKQEKDAPNERKENAFDNLVFPKDGLDRKTIVRSLVAQHFRDRESGINRDEQSDIIRGKGKGLIILLHGAPGVGKTTTAEGIAELFNRPLFQITCGDLGTTAREVETALETNFALANKWGSILLLDEADVFLARRTPQDFKRNGLVAVFLRVLEYYAGILFLTTNRIGDFDEAFSSRIHISLHYPALDYNSTIEIFELNWRLMKARFSHKNRTLDIDTGKITGFIADYWHNQKDARWNGRQIRNACQTALALAEFEAQGASEKNPRNPDAVVHLGVSHMETVANAYLEFIKYLQDVRDIDQEKYGYLMGIRRREGKGIAPEDPLAYNPSASLRGGYPGSLAENRARFAARYNRQEPAPYQQGYGTLYTPDSNSSN